MTSVRQILWKLLVVGMIPFILGAGFPQMECRCAAAKGQRWCECCFIKPEPLRSGSTGKACCQRRLMAERESKGVASLTAATGCPTCHQFRDPKTGSCCSLKQTDAPTLSNVIDAPNFSGVWIWLPVTSDDLSVALSKTALNRDVFERATRIPPLDRVVVFEHLLI